MTNRVLSAVSILGVAAALLAPSLAEAQCRPDDIFCAELRIGPAQPPPPPPVIVQPPPPPIVVQPPPQPPVVIVQPQPQPPPPRIVVVQPQPQPPPRQPQVVAVQIERRRVTRTELVPDFDYGLHLNLGGVFTESAHLGGFGAAFRLRPIEHLAIDLGVGAYGGESNYYQSGGGERWEVPVTANLLFFFNPMHRFQVYAVLGVGMSFAGQQMGLGLGTREFTYVGGEAGLGFEWRLGRHFALNLDMRGFVRENVADGPAEFTRVEGGRTQSTNTSGGFYGTVGMTFYFGG